MLQTHQGQLAVTEVCLRFKNVLVLQNNIVLPKSKPILLFYNTL